MIWKIMLLEFTLLPLQWRHNECDGISNHQSHNCLLDHLFKAQIKENIKAPRLWPLRGEFTGDLLIPCTKRQQLGKSFHLMTSSCQMSGSVILSWLCAALSRCHNMPKPGSQHRSNPGQVLAHYGMFAAASIWFHPSAGTLWHVYKMKVATNILLPVATRQWFLRTEYM